MTVLAMSVALFGALQRALCPAEVGLSLLCVTQEQAEVLKGMQLAKWRGWARQLGCSLCSQPLCHLASLPQEGHYEDKDLCMDFKKH